MGVPFLILLLFSRLAQTVAGSGASQNRCCLVRQPKLLLSCWPAPNRCCLVALLLTVAVLLASSQPLLSPLASPSSCCLSGQLKPLHFFAFSVAILAVSWSLGSLVRVLACLGAACGTCLPLGLAIKCVNKLPQLVAYLLRGIDAS